MKEMRISSDLVLPITAVTQKFAVLGTSGSGKSFTAMKMAELMLAINAQIIAVDPVSIWWSLRLAKNGKSVGYEQVRVFGGDHGDLPLTKESGTLVGRLLAERRFSAVLDVSQFTTGEMKRFLTDFAESFFQAKKHSKSPVHLFLEECQTYIPQDKSDRDDPVMLNRWERLIKFFRNYGGGTSMISQQPQSVNKKCLNLADTLFAMRTIGSHERKAILSWVKDVVESEVDLVARLPKLPTGTAHIWSPS
jgi:DNA helicase HerA-like ATPase